MSTHIVQMTQVSAKEAMRDTKSRFDAANVASEERRWLRHELGDIKEAKAFRRPSKLFINFDGEGDLYGGMGENDSLGG